MLSFWFEWGPGCTTKSTWMSNDPYFWCFFISKLLIYIGPKKIVCKG